LRHSWASRAVEAGADLVLLQHLGGWSSLAMVSRYSHFRQERAVEVITRMVQARAAHRPEPPPPTPRPIKPPRRTR
jgi:site-specific recombinase XerD